MSVPAVGTKQNVLIYPTKEVLWTDELIEKVRTKMAEYQETAIKEDGAGTSEKLNPMTSGSLSDFAVHLPFTETAVDKSPYDLI